MEIKVSEKVMDLLAQAATQAKLSVEEYVVIAVAEKMARAEHKEWLKDRRSGEDRRRKT